MLSRRALPAAFAALALACGPREARDDTPVEHGVWVNMGGPPRPPPPRVDPMTYAPAVRLEGRFDLRDEAGPRCAWPACRAVLAFEGNTARVTLKETAEAWMTGGPSEWDVLVDGAFAWKLVTEPGVHDYTLVTGIHWGVHRVELYRRTEARYGTTQILGFDVHVGELRPAPPPRRLRLEVVGDTTAAGLGLAATGRGEGCPGGADRAAWQNARLAFPQRLADLLDAELVATVATGAGVAQNIWRPESVTMVGLEARSLPFDPESSLSDARTHGAVNGAALLVDRRPIDAIVVMVGEADFAIGIPRDDGPPTEAEFRVAYGELVERLRRRAPEAEIFLATSPTARDGVPAGRRPRTTIAHAIAAVVQDRRDSGDALVHAIAPGPAVESELTGCDGLGGPSLHERVAQELAYDIRASSTHSERGE